MLIVDDHPVICEGFSHMFEFVDGIDVVGTASTARQAMERVDLLGPDVVLLDLHLPDKHGTVVAAELHTQRPDVRVVIFTGGADLDEVRQATAAGVDGVLLKSMPVGDLIRAIRDVSEGKEVVDRDLAGSLYAPGADETTVPLSERELEVLGLLSKGMTNKELAAALFISRATVKSHVENILRKLEVSDRAAAVAEGFRRGLLRS